MEVSDFNVMRIAAIPTKSNTMLPFNANLPHVGAANFLELISRWNREIVDAHGGI
jgi:hypothetical protein